MPFQISPGVNVTEVDLTTIVPSVATSTGAIAGVMSWGPVNQRTLIGSEKDLVNSFGPPNANNAETWFTAANFLSYTNSLYFVRAANSGTTILYGNSSTTTANSMQVAINAYAPANSAANTALPVAYNSNDYGFKSNTNANGFLTTTYDANIYYLSKYPGQYGNSIRVAVCDSVNSYSSNLVANSGTAYANVFVSIGSSNAVITVSNTTGGVDTVSNTYVNTLLNSITIGDYLNIGNSSIGFQKIQVIGKGAVNTAASQANLVFATPYRLPSDFTANGTVNNTIQRFWEFSSVTGTPPATSVWQMTYGNTSAVDTMHVVVVDQNGVFTGTSGSILETYTNVSRSIDNQGIGGANNYYAAIINQNSKYIRWGNDRSGAYSNTSVNLTSSTNQTPYSGQMINGMDGYSETSAPLTLLATGYNQFASTSDVDISLILQGKPIAGSTSVGGMTVSNYLLANYIIQNIAEVRKDCVAFITPDDGLVRSNPGQEAIAINNWRGAITSSSYAVMDSGYKYIYDRYNDIYRYVPMNGDIAGLCARSDNTRDPWWSPAGYDRGQIKNVVKLRYNPSKTDRDLLYPNGINPVVTFPGQGTILFGDKTLQSMPSAFDHINVRRLFIVLEKSISTAAKFFLFNFNDAFTQAQFKALVNPYLREIQGRRGITDYLVVCDSTNNPPVIVDSNQFVGDIYIKPARSINYIQLNFVAVATGVQFSEVVGKF
jgi:phage tail sheath protein FI